MDKLPIALFKEIGDFLEPEHRIYLYLTFKEVYLRFFLPQSIFYKNIYINRYKLCTCCFKRCYKEDIIITLCNCLGNYSVKHYNCTSNSKFNFSLGMTNCSFCNSKSMEFCKLYRKLA